MGLLGHRHPVVQLRTREGSRTRVGSAMLASTSWVQPRKSCWPLPYPPVAPHPPLFQEPPLHPHSLLKISSVPEHLYHTERAAHSLVPAAGYSRPLGRPTRASYGASSPEANSPPLGHPPAQPPGTAPSSHKECSLCPQLALQPQRQQQSLFSSCEIPGPPPPGPPAPGPPPWPAPHASSQHGPCTHAHVPPASP